MARLAVLSVASEMFPLVKTGGLADVVGALPAALAADGIDVTTLIPGYSAVLAALPEAREVLPLPEVFGGAGRLLSANVGGTALLVLDVPHLFDRPGGPYLSREGIDHPDNGLRFGALGRIGALVGMGALPGFAPDIVHVHDWQAGLAPAYIHYAARRGPATVATIHNLAFPGRFPLALRPVLGLPAHAETVSGIEYYGELSYLKAAIGFADRVTTVSPTYASEILTPQDGMGFDGLLRERLADFSGIINGIDRAWDPEHDAQIVAPFDVDRLAERAANTAALRRRFALDDEPRTLLAGVVSRLSSQKGLDLLLDALPGLVAAGVQFAVLGAGDTALERGFTAAVTAYPGRVGVFIGYDESVAHLVQAGADAVLVPSRFEPCGLTQLCALRYGALPIVARVGGLADTVIDANEMALAAGVATGFQFNPVTRSALETAMRRALTAFASPGTWRQMQQNAMRCDVSWERPAQQYAALYGSAVNAHRG